MKSKDLKINGLAVVHDKHDSLYGCIVKIVDNKIKDLHCAIQVIEDPNNGGKWVGRIEPIRPKQLTERNPTFLELNKKLNESLLALLYAQKGNNTNGALDYSEKDYSYISDSLDYIQIHYFCSNPDGDEQGRQYKKLKQAISDKDCYNEIMTRFNNSIGIWLY